MYIFSLKHAYYRSRSAFLSLKQMLNYLQVQLHSDTSRAIAGLSLTGAKYEHVIALLTERYGQSQIIHAHMKAPEILMFIHKMSDVQMLLGALTVSANFGHSL